MDILSHIFSGIAIGATAIHFNKESFKYNSGLILVCGLAAFFPDLDAITYWSKFDETIGAFLNLEERGANLYHQKRWFSHHALFHSLAMALVFTFSFAFVLKFLKKVPFMEVFKNYKLELGAVLISYLVHLFEDMPTPDFVWGGVAFLFPSENYWGGKGYIWWWNNYDLFLIIVNTAFLNVLVKLVGILLKLNTKQLALGILYLAFSLYIKQMTTRPYDFNYSGMPGHHQVWRKNEVKSKEIQKEILGKGLFGIMEKLDNSIPFWF